MAQRFSNPAPQFFYSGTPAAPLSGGLMYFYEPGTTTPKNTYSDNALTTANSNPVVLTASGVLPNVFLSGSYDVTLTDKNDVLQPGWPRVNVNSVADISWGAWDSTVTYGEGGNNIVYASDGDYYLSIQANNLGHEPSASPLWWSPITFVPGRWSELSDIAGKAGLALVVNTAEDGTEWGGAFRLVKVARTSNTILGVANNSQWINITSGTFTQTFEAAATLGSGWWVILSNSGTGEITVGGIDGLVSFIMYPGEKRIIQSNGSALTSIVLNGFSLAYTASATFTKPPGYSRFDAYWIAGGASGGRSGDASRDVGGGGGGAGVRFSRLPSALGTTESITVAGAAAGQSGAGNGTVGGNTSGFGVTAYGGGPGAGNGAADRGGGGGGGAFSVGDTGSTVDVLGGTPTYASPTSVSKDNMGFGGGGGSINAGGSSVDGGGGGGGGGGNGGNSVNGGGGGGGVNGGGAATTGGTSVNAGAGGAGGTNVDGTAGTAPGGGGGGTQTGTISGAGARGEARIWGIV